MSHTNRMETMGHRFVAAIMGIALTSALLAGGLAGMHPARAAPSMSVRTERAGTGASIALERVKLTRQAKPPVFDNADLRNRDFTGQNLEGASFRQAQLQGANFSRARLRGAVFEGAQLANAKFVEAQLQGAQFATATLDGVDFTGAQLQGADLSFELRGVVLAKANLTGVLFGFGTETLLQGADLSGAVLTGADLGRAQLQGANLKGASLRGAELREANLQGADLGNADLRGANLGHAQLQGASLRGAKLWLTLGTPDVGLAELDDIDLRDTTRLTRQEADAIVRLVQEPLRDEARKRLAPLTAPGNVPRRNLTPAAIWKQPKPVARQVAELLAKVACGAPKEGDDFFDTRVDVRVARGLMRNGRIATLGGEAQIVADALRKGRTEPASCPGATGFTAEDWAALDTLARAR